MNKADSKRLKKLKNALSVFSFPFKKRAFSNLNEALISTIFIAFGLVAPFLLIAVIF